MKRIAAPALVLFFCAYPALAIKASIANLAAATTIAVNADTIIKTVRHPKATAKTAGKKIKAAVKGK